MLGSRSINLCATGNLEMKFTNFNDQANEEGLTLEEIGGPISVKYAAALQSPFHCSHSKPSSYPNCTDSGDIPNRIECSLSDFYGHEFLLTTCTTTTTGGTTTGGCSSNCTADESLCEP